jgi:hypothetical protein
MNKRLLILSAALAISAGAQSADLSPGIYAGTCTDLLAASGNSAYMAEVSQVMGQNRARLICKEPGRNYYEDWVWDDATLTVTRHLFIPGNQRPDGRMHQELEILRAANAGGRYQVLPSDPASEYCGMGLHPGSYLTVALTADGFKCETWDPRETGQQANAMLLRTLAFKRIR